MTSLFKQRVFTQSFKVPEADCYLLFLAHIDGKARIKKTGTAYGYGADSNGRTPLWRSINGICGGVWLPQGLITLEIEVADGGKTAGTVKIISQEPLPAKDPFDF